jgi:hypothetical protein
VAKPPADPKAKPRAKPKVKPTPPRSPGRTPHMPTAVTRFQVHWGTQIGAPQEKLAELLGIDKKTLRKHYREELDSGRLNADTKLAARIYKKAMDGDTACLIFLAKTRLGWTETSRHEHSGPNGGAITINHAMTAKEAAEAYRNELG